MLVGHVGASEGFVQCCWEGSYFLLLKFVHSANIYHASRCIRHPRQQTQALLSRDMFWR